MGSKSSDHGDAAVFFMSLMVDFIGGFLLMLSLGVLHSKIPGVPLFGYWPCFLLVVTLTTILAAPLIGLTARLRDDYIHAL